MAGKEEITMDNIEQCIMQGMIDRDPLNNLLQKMNDEYCPKLLGENDWPEGVKKEFATNLHKFMCNLTEACHKRVGRTQLYIPTEDLHDVEAAAKEKDQIQRLEAIVIYWTRQIKELVSNQDSQTGGDNTSPLDEIKHWNQRFGNLNTLKKTLDQKTLLRIIEVLAKA
jgi:dynein heavy chain